MAVARLLEQARHVVVFVAAGHPPRSTPVVRRAAPELEIRETQTFAQ
jgi:hypothetical protein